MNKRRVSKPLLPLSGSPEVFESWMTLAEDVIQIAKCPQPNNNPLEDHAVKAAGKKPESSIELTFSWHAPSHRGAFLTLSH